MSAIGVLHELDTAIEEIRKEPLRQIIWQEVFRKFPPGFIANCERSKIGSVTMVEEWLASNMFRKNKAPNTDAATVVKKLTNFKETTEHGHHFLADKCAEMGLNIVELEKDQTLQELVLSIHHAYVASFARVRSIKFIENSVGSSWNVSG
jgi:hypothetical protein